MVELAAYIHQASLVEAELQVDAAPDVLEAVPVAAALKVVSALLLVEAALQVVSALVLVEAALKVVSELLL